MDPLRIQIKWLSVHSVPLLPRPKISTFPEFHTVLPWSLGCSQTSSLRDELLLFPHRPPPLLAPATSVSILSLTDEERIRVARLGLRRLEIVWEACCFYIVFIGFLSISFPLTSAKLLLCPFHVDSSTHSGSSNPNAAFVVFQLQGLWGRQVCEMPNLVWVILRKLCGNWTTRDAAATVARTTSTLVLQGLFSNSSPPISLRFGSNSCFSYVLSLCFRLCV